MAFQHFLSNLYSKEATNTVTRKKIKTESGKRIVYLAQSRLHPKIGVDPGGGGGRGDSPSRQLTPPLFVIQ